MGYGSSVTNSICVPVKILVVIGETLGDLSFRNCLEILFELNVLILARLEDPGVLHHVMEWGIGGNLSGSFGKDVPRAL